MLCHLRCRIAILREVVRRALITQAEDQLSIYPQYRNHWDDWSLGVITQRVQTKLGLAAEPGDIVLVKPRHFLWYHTGGDETFYSWRNRIDTSAFYAIWLVQWKGVERWIG